MKITLKERTDSHGNGVTHILDMNESLESIKYSALENCVVVTFTTVSGQEVVRLDHDLTSIIIER